MKVSPGLVRWFKERTKRNLEEMGFTDRVPLEAVWLAMEADTLYTIAIVGERDANGDVFTLEGIAESDKYVLVNGRLLCTSV